MCRSSSTGSAARFGRAPGRALPGARPRRPVDGGRLRIAVVGTGIAGLTAARELHGVNGVHDLTVFEAGDRVGGHAHTQRVERWGRSWDVDTGFVVYNEQTYPSFTRLLAELGVATRPSTMSFSVADRATGLEYGGAGFSALFAQRSNLLRPSFLRMIADIVRFNREATALAEAATLDADTTLGELLEGRGFGADVRDRYLAPMGAAIWSASTRDTLRMPAAFFVRFFHNHGLLRPPGRQLQWRTVEGGAQRYVDALARPFASRIRTRSPVRGLCRAGDGVEVRTDDGVERFDEVVLATHADQSLALLSDATPAEREVLGAFRYASNDAVLHTDTRILPVRTRAWSSWNVRVAESPGRPVGITYHMSLLQGLATPEPFLVTLNDAERVDPARVLARMRYEHPVPTPAAIAAQRRHAEINGTHRVRFCGAYWRNGFHEDGHVSALAAVRDLVRREVQA